MDEILELETRRKIYTLLRVNPGLHLSKIAQILKLRVSLVEYHLRYLEKHRVILCDRSTGYARYFLRDEAWPKVKRNFSVLRQESVLKIVLLLLKKKKAQHKDFLEYLQISPSTLSYHLKRLCSNRIIENIQDASGRVYQLKDPEELISWLVKYKPYRLLDGFNDVWKDFTL